jgi:hypothetical protein
MAFLIDSKEYKIHRNKFNQGGVLVFIGFVPHGPQRHETFKVVQERAENTLKLIGKGNDFLNKIPMAQQLRERIDKLNYMKLKSFCTTITMVTRLKRQPTKWEKIIAS